MKEFVKTNWGKAAIVLTVLQLIVSAAFVGSLIVLDMFPAVYTIVIGSALLLLLILSFRLLFSRLRKKDKDGNDRSKGGIYLKRILGTVLAVLLIIIFSVGTYMVVLGRQTIDELFDKETKVEQSIATYVLKDDPAQTLGDAADYTFGVTKRAFWESTQEAIDDINKKLGKEIQTVVYDSETKMVDALRDGDVGAIILNQSYIGTLEETKGYEGFSDETRLLHETTRVTVQKTEVKEDVTIKPFVVYISGSDTRSGKLDVQNPSRSDVNIIGVVNPVTKQILLVSTPRDAYVNTTVSGDMKDKLTHCGIYGIDCSIGTLETLYGIKVSHYAQINFTGFETLIDAIDGVDVYSEKTTRTREGGFQLYEGMNHMSGEVALAFVRDRFNFPDGDYARSRHQMAVIKAVLEKASSGTTIINNYSNILASLEGMFTTDFTSNEISGLAKMQLGDMASWNILNYTTDGEGGKTYTYSMPTQRSYVMYVDETSLAHARFMMQKVLNGEVLTEEEVSNVNLTGTAGSVDNTSGMDGSADENTMTE